MNTELGYLHKNEIFIFHEIKYKVITADGNGNAVCKNIKNGKTEKICLNCEVEIKDGD